MLKASDIFRCFIVQKKNSFLKQSSVSLAFHFAACLHKQRQKGELRPQFN